jgi:hypothetical protein
MPEPTGEIPVEQRQVIFRAIVEAQDAGMSVAASRKDAAERFSVSEEKIKEIEQEGLANQWPPL